MSFTPGPYWRQQEGEAAEKQQSIDEARDRRALLEHAKGDALVSSPRRVGDRLRRMFSRGASPATSVEPDLSEEQIWERERQRRHEYEQDRLNSED
jgi:hypothetical protein